MEEKKQTHVIYGLISGIGMVILGVVFYLLGLSLKPGIQYALYLPFLVGVLLNAMAYSKANDAQVTFGNVFGSCFKVAIIATLILVVWSVVSMFIFPNMKEMIFQSIQERMAQQKMSDEQIDKVIAWYRRNWTTFLIAGSLIGGMFMGLLFSLLGGAIAKKQPAQIKGDNF